jgi:hypothetical protein
MKMIAQCPDHGINTVFRATAPPISHILNVNSWGDCMDVRTSINDMALTPTPESNWACIQCGKQAIFEEDKMVKAICAENNEHNRFIVCDEMTMWFVDNYGNNLEPFSEEEFTKIHAIPGVHWICEICGKSAIFEGETNES